MSLLLRYLIKTSSLPWDLFSPAPSGGISFLIYHKVGGQLPLELDLPAALFRRQLAFLAQSGRVISYDHALALLHRNTQLSDHWVVLTFDDGYEDFYTHVFPCLREFELPAILFVTSGFVEGGVNPLRPAQFETRPVTWEMLGRIQESGLVTLGAHTHTHPWLVQESAERVQEELSRPLQLFQERLGFRPQHFCYPGAFWNEAVERLVKEYYCSAVIGAGRKATPAGFHPYRIPRLPIRASDGWFFFRAKLRGWLAAEEQLYSMMHQVRIH